MAIIILPIVDALCVAATGAMRVFSLDTSFFILLAPPLLINVVQSRMSIAANALPPAKPSSPGAALVTVVAALIGAFVSLGWLIGRRYIWKRAATAAEFSGTSGLPILGTIPWNKPKIRRLASPQQIVETTDTARITETVRGIILDCGRWHMPVKVVQVSSAIPGEGKTSFALLMAR